MERDEEMELAKRTVTPGDGEELLGGKPEDFFRTRGKHVFILSWSGRPIFSRYGDEAELSGFMGVVSALISNFQNLPGDEEPDQIRTVAAGKHKFVFLIRGPVYIVGVSEHPQESQKHIAAQLEYVYLQIVCVLTAGFAKVLECRPTFDLRKLMAGTENLLHSLMNDFSVNPAYLLDSVSCLRMPFQIRTLIGSLLKSAINETIMSDRVPPKSNSPLFALVLAGNKLVNIVRPKDRALHPTDLLLLVNFVCNLVSLRSSESCWTPVCLPKFNSTGYLYAHVSFLQQDISLVLLTAQQDGFYTLQEFKNAIYAGNLYLLDFYSAIF